MPTLYSRPASSSDSVAALRRAVQHHQAGRLPEAETIYGQILAKQPDQVDALHLMGVLAHQAGRHSAAVDLIRRALALSPGFGEAHSNLGNALQALGQSDQALFAYRKAVACQPDSALAQNNLGNALLAQGRLGEAIACYRMAAQLRPGFAEAHYNLGVALLRMGDTRQAIVSFRAAITANPEFAQAFNNLGTTLQQTGQLDEAIHAFQRAASLRPGFAQALNNLSAALRDAGRLDEAIQAARSAIELEPRYAEAYNNLANAMQGQGRTEEAIAGYQQAILLQPDYAEAHYNVGVMLQAHERYEQAVAAYRTSLSLRPDFADGWSNLGTVLMRLDRPDEAIACYQKALAERPDFAGAHYNHGNALQELKRTGEALAAYDHALALDPIYPEAHWNRGLALLSIGEYTSGWPEYEWRWRVKELGLGIRAFAQPCWDGSPLEGRTILVHAEQGLGDTLQFARYLPLVAERGGRIVLECQPGLRRLLEAIPSVAQAVPQGGELPGFDVHVPLLSLPRILGTTVETIPSTSPYLVPVTWSGRMPMVPASDGLKVGIVWAGSARPNPRRSCPLAALAPLFTLEGVSWYSLQVGDRSAELAREPAAAGVHNLAPALQDFADTAGAIAQLDLVVTIDTSVAHLAGALGTDVWVMLMAAPDWRWFFDREDSPWYPSARLFRQRRPGDWDSVVMSVRDALAVRAATAVRPR